MKWTNTIFSVLFFLFGMSASFAQISCEFTLELNDTYGDGWNGASVDIELDGVTTNYGFLYPNPFPGYQVTHPVIVSGTQSINITYNSGFYDYEASYRLVDALGNVVFEDGTDPLIGVAYSGDVGCPSCSPPPPSSVVISDVKAFTADVDWIGSVPGATYLLEYGGAGFSPGSGLVVSTTNTSYTLTNLAESTEYELYLSVVCDGTDTTTLTQPYAFETLIAIDLGIVGVINPVSGCAMSASEMMTIQIQNFGGAPQSFVPFNYSINGVVSNINHPIDGVYTGVLGLDSTDIMDFDMNFDFSEPGEYVMLAWTEMPGDTVVANDTFQIIIVNTPVISDLPVYQNFETEEYSGWAIGMGGQNQSWEFGQPQGNIITNAAGGQNAWVTNLNGLYNSNENSYLESPCFDFSGMTEDPIIDFALYVNGENNFDGLWVETTIDGGQTWTKLGVMGGDGTNWYNATDNIYGDWWSDQNVFPDWVVASHILEGTAGSADVRVRFAFATDGSVQREGFGIDNIYIHGALQNDLSLFGGRNESEDECGSDTDHVIVTMFNHGSVPISNFSLNYQVNDDDPVSEPAIGVTLQPGEQLTYTFNTPFNSEGLTDYTLTVWTGYNDDNVDNNSTVYFSTSLIGDLPIGEDFESGVVPANWTFDQTFSIIQFPNAHNNPTYTVGDNLYSGDQIFQVTTPWVGTVEDGQVLSFDYRYVDYFAGTDSTILSSNDRLEVQIAPFCTDIFTTVYVIDDSNHIPTTAFTTISVDLDDYIGENIKVRLQATWGQGDYWIDIDNINVFSCPESLDITSEVMDATTDVAEDGSITIVPQGGSGPYTYLWNSGETTATLDSLIAGNYAVTVTDNFGCSDAIGVTVEITPVDGIDAPEVIQEILLTPNPTTGLTTLKVRFSETSDAQVRVMNLLGQQVYTFKETNVLDGEYLIDITGQPDGIYLISIHSGNEVKTMKLIKS
jgi:hypothetical protein